MGINTLQKLLALPNPLPLSPLRAELFRHTLWTCPTGFKSIQGLSWTGTSKMGSEPERATIQRSVNSLPRRRGRGQRS